MNCDIVTLLCEVSLGSIALVLILGFFGISITLFGLVEDLQAWYEEQGSEMVKNMRDWWDGRKT